MLLGQKAKTHFNEHFFVEKFTDPDNSGGGAGAASLGPWKFVDRRYATDIVTSKH